MFYTRIKADPTLGIAEHYRVYLAEAAVIETHQDQDRSALLVFILDETGYALEVKRFVATKQVPFVVIMFPVGRWDLETSDGQKYRPQGWFQSRQTPAGPSARVNWILDNQPFPERWARFTKTI